MNKQLYIENYRKNLSILKGVDVSLGDYVCPLCMRTFPLDMLTEEDVPQHSLGGRRITLTCKKCNNTCGTTIDVHLQEAVKGLEQRAFLPGTDRKVTVQHERKKLNAILKVGENRELTLGINTKYNNPKIWDDYYDNILLKDAIIYVQDNPLRQDERRISAAMLKNAYLILFARTGYTFLADAYYDSLRQQIMNPAPFTLPERLWTFQNVSVPDGIYLTRDNRYRGFFVVYSLKQQKTYRVCVLIPTPNVEYLQACYELRKINAGTYIQIVPLPESLDFICDTTAINRLKNWCYGWSLDF